MKIKEGFIIRQVGGENIVVPIEYEVDEATATADVASFVKTLNDPRFVD